MVADAIGYGEYLLSAYMRQLVGYIECISYEIIFLLMVSGQ